MGGGCEFRVEFICSTGRAPHLIHSDPGDTAFTDFMKQFIQLIEDRDKERNNCRMEDYAVDFMVCVQYLICVNKVIHSESAFVRTRLQGQTGTEGSEKAGEHDEKPLQRHPAV